MIRTGENPRECRVRRLLRPLALNPSASGGSQLVAGWVPASPILIREWSQLAARLGSEGYDMQRSVLVLNVCRKVSPYAGGEDREGSHRKLKHDNTPVGQIRNGVNSFARWPTAWSQPSWS